MILPITLTKNAKNKINELCAANTEHFGVHLSLKGGGCAGFEYDWGLIVKEDVKVAYEPIITPEEYKKLIEEDKNLSNNDVTDMNKEFMDFYNEWKGVKYRFGGNSKKGIDCSAFTQRIYKEKFDIKIPRSTWTQVKVGKEVKKSKLELGDLIFFKTGKIDRHVGVYMGNGDFMHASIKGVKFSKVDKPFYKKAYWTSRRIIY